MKHKYLKGQSLFEVVLAIAVVTLITVGIIILATNSIRNSTYSKNKTLASKYAQEGVEWLRDQRAVDPNNFFLKAAAPSYCINILEWNYPGQCDYADEDFISETTLAREVHFSTIVLANGDGAYNAKVIVYWSDSQGKHEVSTETTFGEIR